MKQVEPIRNGKTALSRKQTAALPYFIAPKSIEQGCRDAKVSKVQFYRWLKQDIFRAELEALRISVVSGALDCLKAGMTNAVETLLELLQSDDESIRLKAACAIVDHNRRTTMPDTAPKVAINLVQLRRDFEAGLEIKLPCITHESCI